MWDLGRPLRPDDIHVIVVDYGRVQLARRPAWSWPPLRIRARDVDGPFEGSEPSHGIATRVFSSAGISSRSGSSSACGGLLRA